MIYREKATPLRVHLHPILFTLYTVNVLHYLTASFSLMVMKLAAVGTQQFFSGCRYQTELRRHSLFSGSGRDFSLLQSAHVSSGSHPAYCLVGVALSRPFMPVYCSAEFERVELNPHSPECLYGKHAQEQP
jgi:hypothetical protein